MKILGSLYSNSKDTDKREQAKVHLKKVTELYPDDIEAWIELAQILESTDIPGALNSYGIAMKILKEQLHEDIPPEILNNVASLHFRLGNYLDCKRFYEAALTSIDADPTAASSYYSAIRVSVKYNLARLQEAMCEFNDAEKNYGEILKQYPQYTDCLLRLGCMCRDRGKIHDASGWFNDALFISKQHADAWSLIGNLHLSKGELGLAQKKFERILQSNPNDTYAKIAIGNIWLATLYQHGDKEKIKRHEQRALQCYTDVLKIDPKNIWAANGVGCILAHKGLLNEARDIFAQVREATADFPDVWLNIAHILVEHKQYMRAIQMYENCLKKFYKSTNTDLMIYLARALFKADKLHECKAVLIKARHVTPNDTNLMHNVAIVQQILAKQILSDSKSNLKMVKLAVQDLETAQRTFEWLKTSGGEKFKHDGHEAKKCEDLLLQSVIHLNRAKKLDEEEREFKRKQELEREEQRLKQLEEEERKAKEAEKQKQDLIAKREETVRKALDLKTTIAATQQEEGKKTKKRGKKDTTANDEFIESGQSDADSALIDQNSNDATSSKKKSTKRSKKHEEDDFINDNDENESSKTKKRKREKHKRVKNMADSDEDENEDNVGTSEEKPKKKKKKESKKKQVDKPKSSSMFKSKEFIISDDDSDEKSPNTQESAADDDDDDEQEESQHEDDATKTPDQHTENENDESQDDNENKAKVTHEDLFGEEDDDE